MSTTERYAIPPDALDWNLEQKYTTTFRWEYQDGRESLLNLYEKGKIKQWNAADRIDWSQELDPENPEQMPDESMPIFGSAPYKRMTEKEKVEARTHFQAWQALRCKTHPIVIAYTVAAMLNLGIPDCFRRETR